MTSFRALGSPRSSDFFQTLSLGLEARLPPGTWTVSALLLDVQTWTATGQNTRPRPGNVTSGPGSNLHILLESDGAQLLFIHGLEPLQGLEELFLPGDDPRHRDY